MITSFVHALFSEGVQKHEIIQLGISLERERAKYASFTTTRFHRHSQIVDMGNSSCEKYVKQGHQKTIVVPSRSKKQPRMIYLIC